MPDFAVCGGELVEHIAGLPHQAEPPVQLPKQQEAAVATEGTASEIKHDFPVFVSLEKLSLERYTIVMVALYAVSL